MTVQNSAYIHTGDGGDQVSLDQVTADYMTIYTGAGADTVSIVDSVFEKLGVSLGDGDDSLTITGTSVTKHTYLNGGGGTNTFSDGGGNTLTDLHEKNFS